MAAIDTLQRWANGDTIFLDRLRDSVEILIAAKGTDNRQQTELTHAVQTWADTSGTDLHHTDRQAPLLQPAGIELGL